MEDRRGIIDTFPIDTKEWQEAQIRYGRSNEELETQIGIGILFESLIES